MIEPYLTPVLEWQAEQIERLGAEAERWETLLVSYHRAVLAENDREKTIKLPHGTLSSRKAPDKWEFDDEAFIAWAKANAPDLVRTKDEVAKSKVKDALKGSCRGDGAVATDSGEIVPGVTVTIGEPSFTVTTEEVAR